MDYPDDSREAEGSRSGPGVSPRRTGPRALRALSADRADGSTLDLDRTIHEPLRLGMVCALAVHDVLTFIELKARLQTTDGNLSVHARKLEGAGYVTSVRGFDGRVPKTEFRLTRAGRKAFDRYLDTMESIVRSARSAGAASAGE